LLMTPLSHLLSNLILFTATLLTLIVDVGRFLRLCLRPPTTLAAENLFLRKQLALYQERHVKPRRATNATRLALVWLSRWFSWRQALAIVQPDTFTRWHRQGFRLFWRWKSRCGRPPRIDISALAPGTLEGTIFPPQRMNVRLALFEAKELVDI
jgi:hypothetical protein